MNRPNEVKNEAGEILKAGCVIVYEGKILLVTGKDGTIWSFPKGHVETGETVEETAIREAREETGYEVEIIKRLPDLAYTNTETGEPIRVAMFKAKPIKETDSRETETRSEWFPIEEAKKLLYHKPDFLLDEMGE